MRVPTEQITDDRLEKWKKRLSQSHATPLLLMAVGHDESSGQIVLCTLDEPDMSTGRICHFLRHALRELEQ